MIHINVIGLARLAGQRVRRLDAIDLLGISRPTFDRLVASGQIKVERDPTQLTAGKPGVFVQLMELGRFLGITDEDRLRVRLGLPSESLGDQHSEPDAPPTEGRMPEPQREAFTRPPSAIEIKQAEDLRFAEDYRAGLATDSAGNTALGTNKQFPVSGAVTLIGPRDRQPKETPSGSSHMDERLVAMPTAANPIDSDAYQEVIHPGHGERMEAMYRNAGVKRQPSEQQSKAFVDRAAIELAFRQGFAR